MSTQEPPKGLNVRKPVGAGGKRSQRELVMASLLRCPAPRSARKGRA